MRVERRKNKRYCIKGSVFAGFKPEPVKMAPVIDISLGGLGISVRETDDREQGLNKCSFLEIMLADCSFYLDGLPYELLPESRNFNPRTGASLQNRFYGMKFLNLMPSQKVHLKYFIRKYTIGGITPQFIHKMNQFFRHALGKTQFGHTCQDNWLHRSTF